MIPLESLLRPVDWLVDRLQATKPRNRVRAAMALLVFSFIAWPVTSLTVFAKEPQGLIALSWVAFIATCIDIVMTTEIHEQE